MSLGRTKGAVWIGRPLDISVQVKLDPGEDAASLCLAADVLYADSRVNSGQVRVFVEPGASLEETTLRIQASAPVDEPVVNIYLKAGCAQAFTRRYVLLAEVPVDYRADGPVPLVRAGSATSTAGRDVQSVPSLSGVGATGLRPPFRSAPRAPASVSAETEGPAPKTPGAAKAAADRPVPVRSVVRKATAPSPVTKARLKLDPAELLIERDPVLHLSMELLSAPQENQARRAEAAALWRAINASPEEILKDAQRLQAMQADVAALRGQNQKSQTEIAELKTKVQTLQSERVDRSWVFGLAAALVVAIAAAVFFWLRIREQSRRQWWSLGDEIADAEQESVPPPGVAGAVAVPGNATAASVDIDLSAMPPPVASTAARPSSTPPLLAPLDGIDFQTSLTGAGRAVKVEELLDIQQQADFFISLGQYEQAVATLRTHIADNVETSALAYLDLLKIYHMQGRQKDYELVRKEFNDVFNAEVPEFAAFGQQSRGLETYESAISRIAALWPTPKVLDVIEESIFRKPGQGSQVFDLEAYRELLMLYAVAKELVDGPGQTRVLAVPGAVAPAPPERGSARVKDSAREPLDFLSTKIQPLPVATQAGEAHNMPLLRVPPSPNLGLDIDLTELVAAPSAELPTVASAKGADTRAPDTKAPDSHLIDFDLFDLATKAHANSKRGKP